MGEYLDFKVGGKVNWERFTNGATDIAPVAPVPLHIQLCVLSLVGQTALMLRGVYLGRLKNMSNRVRLAARLFFPLSCLSAVGFYRMIRRERRRIKTQQQSRGTHQALVFNQIATWFVERRKELANNLITAFNEKKVEVMHDKAAEPSAVIETLWWWNYQQAIAKAVPYEWKELEVLHCSFTRQVDELKSNEWWVLHESLGDQLEKVSLKGLRSWETLWQVRESMKTYLDKNVVAEGYLSEGKALWKLVERSEK